MSSVLAIRPQTWFRLQAQLFHSSAPDVPFADTGFQNLLPNPAFQRQLSKRSLSIQLCIFSVLLRRHGGWLDIWLWALVASKLLAHHSDSAVLGKVSMEAGSEC